MLGVNEIKSTEEIPTEVVLGLCESMLSSMEEPDNRRLRRQDQDRYYRTLKTQFKRLDERYPGIFNVLLEYGRRMPPSPGAPEGLDIVEGVTKMLQHRDSIAAKMQEGLTREEAGEVEDKAIDYEYAQKYVAPAIGEARFDAIVPNPAAASPEEPSVAPQK